VIVTPLAYDRAWNNRDHNMVRAFDGMGCRLTVLYQALNRSTSLTGVLGDTFGFRISDREEGAVRYVRVDPLFNYFAGYRSGLDARALGDGRRVTSWHRAVRVLSPLGALRSLFFVPCMLWAAWRRCPRPQDVCVGFGPLGAAVGWLLRAAGRVTLLVYEDRDFEPGLYPDRVRRWVTARIEAAMARRADLVISVGHRLAHLRRSQTAKPVHVVHNGVDWDLYERARASGARSGNRLLHVGNLVPWSGVEVGIRAMPRILAEFPDASFTIVGGGSPGYERFLERLIRDLNLEEHVHLTGPRPNRDIPELLGGAAVGLANSEPVEYRRYAFPLKVLEYMAGGLPTIATEDTEAADMVSRYDCGLAAAYRADAVGAAVTRILADPGLRERFRANAIRHSSELRWERLLARELQLIRDRLDEVCGPHAGLPSRPSRSTLLDGAQPRAGGAGRPGGWPGMPRVRG
jgi:glycosyltransferase involved in cell wall biosynthesis